MLFVKKKRLIERVLLVEDEPLVAFDTEHFLTHEGFEIVATLDSVAEALAAIEDDAAIDLVLVDVELVDGSGVEVARAAHARGMRVVFVTGNCPGEARKLAAGCLSKPYPQRDLLAAIAAIEAVIEGRKPPRRLPASFSLFVES
ncbi:DNA-binding response OmpR family regulator [Sphingomonas naasensis]|uniref:Response regulator n=1 Tax=Sphingomonas naasensis TaxID=1344951 RepID=A0A4S1WQL5_9SPHN|nr:response regulator [Sphingomonas naasensis]NIJ18363.1 DNA-binding response OmpR family regulator [Sphingomonas naasensis]TGX45634.1 response regulator [Sphingomonas naasensis]